MLRTTIGSLKVGSLRLFGTLRRWVIGPYAVAVLSRTENGLLLAPADDLMVGRRLCFNGRYDSELLSFFLEKCQPQSTILFVGAHVGALVIPVARKVARVSAIEANPTILKLLQINVLLNGLTNVEVQGLAAGNRNGDASFLACSLNSGGSGLEIGERDPWANLQADPQRINVQMRRLDDVFPSASFDLIVMDIEGAEALALRGMGKLLERSKGLLIEVFESHLRNVARVSDSEFLSLVSPFYDEAVILPEKPRDGKPISSATYRRPAFPEMMQECCKRRMANVMFWKA